MVARKNPVLWLYTKVTVYIQGHSMGFDQIQFNGTLLPFTGAYSGGWQSKARAFLCLLRLLTFAQNGKCLC